MSATRSVFVIDYFFDKERQEAHKAGPRRYAHKLREQGNHVDIIYAFCVPDAMVSICRDVEKQKDRTRKIDVLRFYGHGGYGVQNVGGNHDFTNEATLLGIKGGRLRHEASLALIYDLVIPKKTRIELHGCKVGGGKGEKFLQALSDLLRVEVLASAVDQKSISSTYASKFEGMVMCAKPGMKGPFIRAFE